MLIAIFQSIHDYIEGTLVDNQRHDFNTMKEAFDFVEELKKEFTDSNSSCLFNIHYPKQDRTHGFAFVNTVTLCKTTQKPKYNQVACELTIVIK